MSIFTSRLLMNELHTTSAQIHVEAGLKQDSLRDNAGQARWSRGRTRALAVWMGWLFCGSQIWAAAPEIITQPAIQAVAVGGTATLDVTSTGTGPLAYQWFKNGAMAVGATRSTLSLANADVPDSGVYYVVVTNSYGMRISQPVTVTVGNPQLLAWGRNNHGQLGDGTTTNRLYPEPSDSNVVAAAAGDAHSLYLKGDGTLWTMGDNEYGQLGDGTTNSRSMAGCIASNVVAVAGGYSHSLFVKIDGTLWAMGNNNWGQLGDGTTSSRSSPVSVASNVVAIAGGGFHSLYLKHDGTLCAMGNNSYGQLGDGTHINQSNAVSVASNVVALAGGDYHSLFVKCDGTLWAMGRNDGGELGDGTIIQRSNAVSVASNVVAVVAGAYHSLYLNNIGTLWAMGYNHNGQLGDGTTTSRSSPVSVASNVVAIAAGSFYSLYLKNDSTLWAMGNNDYGQLGEGSTIERHSPVAVPGPALATVLAGCGAFHTLAVGVPLLPVITSPPEDQTVMAGTPVTFTVIASGLAPLTYQWLFNGTNISGAVATNYHLASVTLANAGTYAVLVSNSIGSVTSSPAALAVLMSPIITTQPASQQVAADGTVNLSVAAAGTAPLGYQWLKNGKVIAGATRSSLSLPGTGATNSGIYYVVVTNGSGLIISQPARVAAGSPLLLAWGYNSNGQLGDGTTNTALWPEAVDTDVVVAAAGGAHSLYLKSDGTLWGMGWNNRGELGDGTTTQRTRPEALTSNVVAVATGEYHSLFLRSDGTLWAMGNNGNGQLGNGSTVNQLVPGSVASNVVAMAAGADYSLFLKNDGTLWGMGYNYDGELGDGTTTDRHSPVAVISGTNVVAVTAGAGHTLFLRSDGSLWGIGYNINGELGDGTYVNRSTPIAVRQGSGTVAAAGGANHTLFLRGDGTLWAMGYNALGELGDGTTSGRSTPETVATNGAAVAAGWYCSLFAKGDGTLWTMGYNFNGGLGNGIMSQEHSPILLGGISAASVSSCSHGYHALAVGLTLPPEIAIHPTNQTVAAGNTVTFSVAASGFGPLGYQWQLDGTNFANATNATLTLTGVSAKDAGSYVALVNSAAGSTGSGAAVLVVNKAEPVVTTWPTATAITSGQTLASSTLTGGAASVGGTFDFTTPALAPGAGTALQPVTFTPDDPASYSSVTGSVSVTVMAIVTVTAYPANAGTVTGEGAYIVGSNAVLTATAINGWRFVSWNDGATDNPHVIVAPPTNCTYTANFLHAATVTTEARPPKGGWTTGGGTYAVGSNAILTATASNGWVFLNWNGTITNYTKTGNTNNPLAVEVTTDTTHYANFARITNGFVYTVASGGMGLVAIIGYEGSATKIRVPEQIEGMKVSSIEKGALSQQRFAEIDYPASLDCITPESSCADVVEFFAPTTEALAEGVATEIADGAFVGVVESCLLDELLPAATALALLEALADELSDLVSVYAKADPSDGGSCSGSGLYDLGRLVDLTAKAKSGWEFIRWDNGRTSPTITVAAGDKPVYVAKFEQLRHVKVVADPENGGSVSVTDPTGVTKTGGGFYLKDTLVTLTATTNLHWQFLNWNDGTTNRIYSTDPVYEITVPDHDITYTASFAQMATVTVKASPTNGGFVTGGGTYLVGSTNLVRAEATNGWVFTHWNDGTTNHLYVITVPETNVTYTAHFESKATITVEASPTNGGFVTGGGTFIVGSTNIITAEPHNGWIFTHWNGGATNNPRSILVVSNTTYTATFTPMILTIYAASDSVILDWPTNRTGWVLQAHTNGLRSGVSEDWYDLPGSEVSNSATIPRHPSNPATFYRLRQP